MKLDKHIHELLFQHNCVIVPGLGGFIANFQSAHFNPSLQIFYPPSKKVAFNSDLKENDGILAKYVSKKQECSYDEANKSIHEAVRTIYERLKSDKLVEIEKVGFLRYNKENNIEFNPGSESNYLLSSFGMSPVQAPAIKRIASDKTYKQNQAPEEILIAPNTYNRKLKIKQPWKILEVVPIAALLFYIILIPGSANKINHGLSQMVPDINVDFSRFFENKTATNIITEESDNSVNENYATSGVYVDDKSNSNLLLPEDVVDTELNTNELSEESNPEINAEETVIKKIEPEIIEKSKPVKEEVKPLIKSVTPTVKAIHATEKYHIIGGAFGVKDNADRYLKELKTYGYKAQIIGVNKRGLHMVSVHSTSNSTEMQSELVKIKKVISDKVWVLTN